MHFVEIFLLAKIQCIYRLRPRNGLGILHIDQRLNRNIFIPQGLKFERSSLINRVYRQRHSCGHVTFPWNYCLICKFLLEI